MKKYLLTASLIAALSQPAFAYCGTCNPCNPCPPLVKVVPIVQSCQPACPVTTCNPCNPCAIGAAAPVMITTPTYIQDPGYCCQEKQGFFKRFFSF